MKRDLVKIAFLMGMSALIFLALTRCEEDPIDYENINCLDCFVEEPQQSYLEIQFSEDICDTVKLTVYRGYAGESMLEWEGYAQESPFLLYETPVNYLYSVKATYQTDTASIVVVDADKLKTNLVKGICDEDCFIITGGIVDVEYKKD